MITIIGNSTSFAPLVSHALLPLLHNSHPKFLFTAKQDSLVPSRIFGIAASLSLGLFHSVPLKAGTTNSLGDGLGLRENS